MNAQPRPPAPPPLLADPVARGLASIAVLTLNRPQTRNSLSEAMLEALGDALTAIGHDATSAPSSSPPTAQRSPPATTSRSSPATAPTPIAAAPISSTS